MTIPDLLADDRLRHEEFPVTTERVFLAHAGVSPLPRRVSCAMQDYLQRASVTDQDAAFGHSTFLKVRQSAARLLAATPEEIAIVGPTSMALSLVATGMRWNDHANVLVYQDDYPSNVYPWMALVERGVEVRFLKPRQPGRIHADDVFAQVDEATQLVALSSCHYLTGHRIDLEAIGKGLRERGILFCVDAIQTLGAFRTTLEHVDILAAGTHKWLLGPCGGGLLVVRREVQERLRPSVHGWHNVRCPDFIAQDVLNYRPDARRYEPGTHSLLNLVGILAALDLALELGVDQIETELTRKRRWLVSALQAKGYRVLKEDAPGELAGSIVTCGREHTDMNQIHQRLTQVGIVTSLRSDRSGRRYVRFSPHYYNTDAELQRVVELV